MNLRATSSVSGSQFRCSCWQKFSNAVDKPKDQDRYGLGAHYYFFGTQNLKLSGQWLRVKPKSPLKDTNEFTIQLQMFYY